ncbi:MAG: hypothetical protein ABJA20_08075 [Novosphingobium sp.]
MAKDAPVVITATTQPDFEQLAANLAGQAKALAEAQTAAAALESRNDPLRWRQADLLWPLFTKG